MQIIEERVDISVTTASPEAVHRFRVRSADVAAGSVVDGGTLLEWIDTAAHATAARWCTTNCVAVSMSNFHLRRPLRVGGVAEIRATLVYTGRASMHILVTLAAAEQTAQCAMVFVALGGDGAPTVVPPWTPSTMLEWQHHRQARARSRMCRHIEDAVEAETYSEDGSAVTLRFRGGLTDVTGDGRVRGGRVMRWMDEAVFACATEWTGGAALTSYVAGIRMCQPVLVGDVVDVTARIIHTGRRSVHVGVVVRSEDASTIAHGVIVAVCPDAGGFAQAVPQWLPASDDDRRLDRHARHLIALREYQEPFSRA
jgi:acyl-CoA hydrolase